MAQNLLCNGWQFKVASPLVVGVLAFSGNSTLAQIVPDNTLGNQNSIVTPISPQTDQIGGGWRVTGSKNLFHSFSKFNINNGRIAEFLNPSGVQNIFSRVTGNTSSNLFGVLRVTGDANLFLINPNGIIFGPNARLDMRGSFFASTANSLLFSDGTKFSATNLGTPPLLSVDVRSPIGLQFEGIPGAIQVQGSFLAVDPGKTLGLVGGKISADNGLLQASGGRVELSAVAGVGTVGVDSNNLRVSIPDAIARGDISLGKTGVYVGGDRAGAVQIQGKNVTLTGEFQVQGNNVYAIGAINANTISQNGGEVAIQAEKLNVDQYIVTTNTTGAGRGGDVTVKANSVTLTNGGLIRATTDGSGRGGDVTVKANSVTLTNGGLIGATTNGTGRAGDLTVTASDEVNILGIPNTADSGLTTSTFSTGNGGNLTIKTGRLLVKDGGVVTTVTTGAGKAGDLTVEATDSVKLIGAPAENHESGLFSGSAGDGNPNTVDGNGGNLTVKTGQLIIQDGAQLVADNLPGDNRSVGTGKPGNVTIIASQSVEVSGTSATQFPKYGSNKPSGIVTFTENAQDAGDLTIKTGRFIVKDGGSISTGTDSSGHGGKLTIEASDSVEIIGRSPINGNGTRVRSITSNSGNGGDVTITTGRLSITDGGRLDTRTKPNTTTPSGNAGNIDVTANLFEASGGGQIIATTSGDIINNVEVGSGKAGNITITADRINLSGVDQDFNNRNPPFNNNLFINEGAASGIVTKAKSNSIGKAGNIEIATSSLTLTDGAQLSASTFGQNKAGDIHITSSDSTRISGVNAATGLSSGLFTDTSTQGRGGNITVDTGTFSVADGAVLNTRTRANGAGGNIIVNAKTFEALSGGQLITTTSGSQPAGNITVNSTDSITLSGSDPNYANRLAQFGSDVVTNADAASGLFANTDKNSTGAGGAITVTANTLSVTNGGILQTSTFGRGDAGNIDISVRDTAIFDGIGLDNRSSGAYSRVEEGAVGQSGSIDINKQKPPAKLLSLTNGAILTTSTAGIGRAGSIDINARDIVIDGSKQSSGAFSDVKNSGQGQGGSITLTGDTLSLTNGGVLQTSTFGRGDAGNIDINVIGSVNFDGVAQNGFSSGLYSTTEANATGKGGEIKVTTAALRLQDGAMINAQTRNAGSGGSVVINANTVEAINGGQVITTTYSSGKAGNITVNSTDSITLSGSDPNYANRLAQFGSDVVTNADSASGLFANTDKNSTGAGGAIFINKDNPTGKEQLTVRDGARISVNSQGSGVGGNIEATARRIDLDTNGAITAASQSSNGGNIILNIQDLLLMRHQSNISASAGEANAGGNGGNVTINASNGFVVAVPREDSNIKAQAYSDQGGNVSITTQRIFGLQLRRKDTPITSDITVSSQFGTDGTVQTNTLNTDPTSGLNPLPDEPRSPEISIGCQVSQGKETVQFFDIGRGGTPPRPDEPLNIDTLMVEWSPLASETNNSFNQKTARISRNGDENIQSPTFDHGEVFNITQSPKVPYQILPPCQSR